MRLAVQELLASGSNDIYRQISQMVDRVAVELVLDHCHGNPLQAAERLGISRVTLRTKLRAIRGEFDSGE